VAAESPFQFDPTDEITVWEVSGTKASPVLDRRGKIQVPSYKTPPNAKQPGTSFRLDTHDTRLTQAVAARDPNAGGSGTMAIWTQHTIKDTVSGNSAVRWHELLPAALDAPGMAGRRQGGTIRRMGAYAFNGAISPGMNGTAVVIHYNVSGKSTYAQIRARSRKGGTALGEMGPEITLANSNPYVDQDLTCGTADNRPGCRWGDYAGASPDPDPANPSVVWGSNQLNGPPNGTQPSWATRNFALRPTP
jgi:hypothetical protein